LPTKNVNVEEFENLIKQEGSKQVHEKANQQNLLTFGAFFQPT
jgi:hypothetical protein